MCDESGAMCTVHCASGCYHADESVWSTPGFASEMPGAASSPRRHGKPRQASTPFHDGSLSTGTSKDLEDITDVSMAAGIVTKAQAENNEPPVRCAPAVLYCAALNS